MRLSLTFIPAIISLGLATASPATSPDSNVNTTLTKKQTIPAQGSCQYCDTTANYYTNYQVFLEGNYDNWLGDYGKGFYDNLNGECGNVEGWTFEYDVYWVSGTASFSVVGSPSCVEAAAWDASLQTLWGMECQNTGYCSCGSCGP